MTTRLDMMRNFLSWLLMFFIPVTLVLLFPACHAIDDKASGPLKILYTSEVGGKIDPCG